MEPNRPVSQKFLEAFSFGFDKLKEKINEARNSEAAAATSEFLSSAKDTVAHSAQTAMAYAKEKVTRENVDLAAQILKEKSIAALEKTKELAVEVSSPEFRQNVKEKAIEAYNTTKQTYEEIMDSDEDSEEDSHNQARIVEEERPTNPLETQPVQFLSTLRSMQAESQDKKLNQKTDDSDSSDSDEEDLKGYKKPRKNKIKLVPADDLESAKKEETKKREIEQEKSYFEIKDFDI